MSEIRMCDTCGRIFSMNEPGWSQYTRQNNIGNNVTFGPNGNTVTMHICPDHSTTTEPTIKPRMELEK